jgi:hypothetical protein
MEAMVTLPPVASQRGCQREEDREGGGEERFLFFFMFIISFERRDEDVEMKRGCSTEGRERGEQSRGVRREGRRANE